MTSASTGHLINQELIELSDLEMKDKYRETKLNNEVFNLTIKMNNNVSTIEDQEKLAVKISLQRTKRELLEGETSFTKHKCLDYVIHKVGRATKAYQRENKIPKETLIKDISEKLGEARENEDPYDEEMRDIEAQMDNALEEIFTVEKA